jgi:hypothetical protein
MTVTVANTANTNTFDYWRNRTNELASAMTTKAVTVDSNTATGNAAITGNFNANTIVIGNSTVNVAIASSNSVQQSNGQYFLNANGSWTNVGAPYYVGTTSTTGTSGQLIDSYSMSTYGAAEYLINVKDNSANARVATKILTVHNTVDVLLTEYSVLVTNSSLGVFTANANTTHARLYYTPNTSSATLNYIRYTI